MSASPFDRALNQLKDGVADVFKSKRMLPSFLLLYTSVDILGSLMRPEKSDATHSSYFKEWVTKYMLPSLESQCSADDLWGARCGLLHTLTAESDMSRNTGARILNYIGDAATAKAMQQKHGPTGTHEIFLSTHQFVDAFLSACERFAADVRSNTALETRVSLHAAKLIVAFN